MSPWKDHTMNVKRFYAGLTGLVLARGVGRVRLGRRPEGRCHRDRHPDPDRDRDAYADPDRDQGQACGRGARADCLRARRARRARAH